MDSPSHTVVSPNNSPRSDVISFSLRHPETAAQPPDTPSKTSIRDARPLTFREESGVLIKEESRVSEEVVEQRENPKENDQRIQGIGHEGFKEKTADDELREKVKKKHPSLANDEESQLEADLHIERSGHEGFKEKTADNELREKMEILRKHIPSRAEHLILSLSKNHSGEDKGEVVKKEQYKVTKGSGQVDDNEVASRVPDSTADNETVANIYSLPADILLQIAELLDLRSLCRMSCVSRFFDVLFAGTNLKKYIRDNFCYLIINTSSNTSVGIKSIKAKALLNEEYVEAHDVQQSFEDVRKHSYSLFKIVGSSKGLLCIDFEGVLYVWCPISDTRTPIPFPVVPNYTKSNIGFSYIGSVGEYKILSIFGYDTYSKFCVYRISCGWRELINIPCQLYGPGVTVNEIFYSCFDPRGCIGEDYILRYDMANDRCSLMPIIPCRLDGIKGWSLLGSLGGGLGDEGVEQLCVYHFYPKNVLLWKLNEDCVWESTYNIPLAAATTEHLHRLPTLISNSGNVLIKSKRQLMYFDTVRQCLRTCYVQNFSSEIPAWVTHISGVLYTATDMVPKNGIILEHADSTAVGEKWVSSRDYGGYGGGNGAYGNPASYGAINPAGVGCYMGGGGSVGNLCSYGSLPKRSIRIFESKDPILNLACSTCARLCLSKTEADLHIQRSRHEGFKEKTADDEMREKIEMVRDKHPPLANDAEYQMGIFLAALQIPSRAELLRECLRLLKLKHKDDDATVGTSIDTLYTFVRNIALNPNDEKFRKIRVANVHFQNSVGNMAEGINFLKYCGFESVQMHVSRFGGFSVEEFLYLPRNKVDMHVLGAAGTALKAAINEPFFGFF